LWAGDTYGIGECYPSAPVAAVNSVVTALADQLVGEDPRDVHRLAEKMRRWNIFTGGQGGTVVTAISGLEMASCWAGRSAPRCGCTRTATPARWTLPRTI
jgi:L-alanine-DL-glutamate epimerase-like enolase superfamily enzyme